MFTVFNCKNNWEVDFSEHSKLFTRIDGADVQTVIQFTLSGSPMGAILLQTNSNQSPIYLTQILILCIYLPLVLPGDK